MSEPALETVNTKTTSHNLRYASIKSISIHWPERNYECINNTCQFQDILQVLSYPRAEEFTIPRGPNAGWAVNKKLREILKEARSIPWIREQRSLVILHYAGDSIRTESFISRERTLFVDTEESRETYPGDTTDFEFNPEEKLIACAMFDEGYDPDHQFQENVDVLFIFDCPYHLTDIDFQSRERVRTVEIVAAAESQPGGDPRPLIKHKDSFEHQVRYAASSALLSEIERRKKEGCRHVEIADVVESLEAKKVKTSKKRKTNINIAHQRRLGMDPINLHVLSAAAEDSCRPS
ncbi:hypothetical protein BDV19DRAFT_387138 [Aspergillus venezuelensis]